MVDSKIKEKLDKEKNVSFVNEINYCGKKYVKTIKQTKKGIEYVYYEINNNQINEVKDLRLITYFRDNYEIKSTNIIY